MRPRTDVRSQQPGQRTHRAQQQRGPGTARRGAGPAQSARPIAARRGEAGPPPAVVGGASAGSAPPPPERREAAAARGEAGAGGGPAPSTGTRSHSAAGTPRSGRGSERRLPGAETRRQQVQGRGDPASPQRRRRGRSDAPAPPRPHRRCPGRAGVTPSRRPPPAPPLFPPSPANAIGRRPRPEPGAPLRPAGRRRWGRLSPPERSLPSLLTASSLCSSSSSSTSSARPAGPRRAPRRARRPTRTKRGTRRSTSCSPERAAMGAEGTQSCAQGQ